MGVSRVLAAGISTGLALLLAGVGSQATAYPGARWIPAHSSNYTRMSSRSIDRVVIHTVEGSEAGCISWFQNSRSNVSAHYVLSHAGRVTQMVREQDRAWHCGRWNDRSIGIENEGWAGRNNWTATQYRVLADLTREICNRYGIPKDRTHIVGHVEVPGATHTDPGRFFDWNRFMNLVRGTSSPPPPPPSGGTTTYTVRSGDTLGGIAHQFGTTVSELQRLNNIPNPNLIHVGQRLIVPTSGGSPPPPPPVASSLTGLEVTAGALNVRASIMGTILGQIQRGQRFVATSQSNGWYRIDYRGRHAWVSGSYVRRVAVTSIVVTANSLNVRSGPSTGNTRIGALPRNFHAVKLGQSGAWILIQFDHRRAYVHGSYANTVSVR